MLRYTFLFLVLATSVTACDPEPVGPGGPEPNDSVFDVVEFPVLGHGTTQERYTAEVAARDDWAYTSTWSARGAIQGNAIKIWDVSGDTPLLVDSLIVESAATLGDVQISDDGSLLVVATERSNGSIVIYDRSADPRRPVRLSRHMSNATRNTGVHTVKLGRVNGRHYAFLSVNPGPPRLVVVDITDPANPVEVLVKVMGVPYIHDVFVRDGLLFTALWNGGLSIWDIGGGGNEGADPSNPILIGNVQTVNGAVHNIWWYHAPDGSKRYAFVGEEGPGSLGASSTGDVHVVDVSDMTQPREVAFFHVPGAGAHNFVMDEEAGVLYAAFYNGGVRALDVRGDLSDCEPNQRDGDRCNLGLMDRQVGVGLHNRGVISIWGVAKVGDVIYASDMLTGLFALDASGLRAR